MTLFELAHMLNAEIGVIGQVYPKHSITVHLAQGVRMAEVIADGTLQGVYGSSNTGNLQAALRHLAACLSNKTITFDGPTQGRQAHTLPTITVPEGAIDA
jgi:hypothetical protein